SGAPVWVNVLRLVAANGHRRRSLIHLFHDVTASKRLLALVQDMLTMPKKRSASPGVLTPRELEVLRLIATGADTKTIATRLHVSTATVRNHVQNILGKLRVHSRLQAFAYVTTHHLL